MRGFSLIELILTIALITILTNIALPVYHQHIVRAQRLTAIKTLLTMATLLENNYLIYQTYQGTKDLTTAINGYEFITNLQHHKYRLQAKPIKQQARRDQICGTLIFDHDQRKQITGDGKWRDCWFI